MNKLPDGYISNTHETLVVLLNGALGGLTTPTRRRLDAIHPSRLILPAAIGFGAPGVGASQRKNVRSIVPCATCSKSPSAAKVRPTCRFREAVEMERSEEAERRMV